MEIGTSIFLIGFLVFVLLLYVFTRDRVRWGRIIGWAVILLLIIGAVFGTYLYWTNRPEHNRRAILELDGVKLGETESDLLFKKGNYESFCNFLRNKKVKSFLFEYGSDSSKKYNFVRLRDGVVQNIVIAGDIGYSSIEGASSISVYDDENALRRKWGAEDFIRVIDTNTRTYVYRKYNLAVSLKNNKVEAIHVYNPDYYFLSPASPPKEEKECYDANGKKL